MTQQPLPYASPIKHRKPEYRLGWISLGLFFPGLIGAANFWRVPDASICFLICSLAGLVLATAGVQFDRQKKIALWGLILNLLAYVVAIGFTTFTSLIF